jgi:uncharacterized protein YegL
MNKFTKNATRINNALLSLLLLSAYLKQEPLPLLFVGLLVLTWGIYAAQHFKAFTNIKATANLLNTMQVATMLIAGVSLLMLFIR